MAKKKYPSNLTVLDGKPTKAQLTQIRIINTIAKTYGTLYAAILVALINQFGETFSDPFYPDHSKIVDDLQLTTEKYLLYLSQLEAWGFIIIQRVDNEVDGYTIVFELINSFDDRY